MKTPWSGKTRRQSRLIRHTLILLVVGGVLALITLRQPFGGVNSFFADRLFLPESPSPNIVIVAIDDKTLEDDDINVRLASEVPRSRHAQVVENLSQAKAKVIAFDMIFAGSTSDDPVLASAMQQAGNVVLADYGDRALGDSPDIVYQEFKEPTADLLQVSSATGHVNISPDSDRVVRSLPLAVKDAGGESYPALTLAALDVHFANPNWALPQDYAARDGKLDLFGRAVPVDDAKRMRVNYVGGPGSFTTLSYVDVLKGNFNADDVKYKVVLIGVTATGESDFWPVPGSSAKMPGVEIHANAIDTILRERFLVDASNSVTLLTIVAIAIVLALFLPRMKLRWGGLMVAGLVAAYIVAVVVEFQRGYVLNVIYPPMALVVVYVAGMICAVSAEQQRRRDVKDVFGRYVSPQVADQIMELSDNDKLRLGGEQREVTVAFADLRGFTSLSEQRSPEAMVDLLNRYFSTIIEAILSNGGMVNKFGGDNILAVWNAPEAQEDHPYAAVKAAMEAQEAMKKMQEDNPDLLKVQFGFGINTGEVLAGNVGSEGRLEYTVIGDAVNLAARLCGAAPGGEVWISPQVYEGLKDRVEVRELEPQQFKGKSQAIVVYQVLRVL